MDTIRQFTMDEAKAIFDSGEWKDWTDEEIVKVQLFQDRLCVPWAKFHAAVGKVLGRPVYTHEFAGDTGQQRLIDEYLGKRPAPTLEEIVGLLPKDKVILVSA